MIVKFIAIHSPTTTTFWEKSIKGYKKNWNDYSYKLLVMRKIFWMPAMNIFWVFCCFYLRGLSVFLSVNFFETFCIFLVSIQGKLIIFYFYPFLFISKWLFDNFQSFPCYLLLFYASRKIPNSQTNNWCKRLIQYIMIHSGLSISLTFLL